MWAVVGSITVNTDEIACVEEFEGTTVVTLKSGVDILSDVDYETWHWILGPDQDLPSVEIMSVNQEGFQDLLECLDPECEVKIFEDELYFKFNDSLLKVPEGSVITEKGVFAPVKVYKAMLKG